MTTNGESASRGGEAPSFRVPKTGELVAQRLRARIIRGELAEGDSLPAEGALIEEFGVSRPTLREAYRVLEAEQLISVRRGARGGARVHAPSASAAARYAGLVLEYEGATLADVYEARTLVETPCAALLARRRTKQDLKLLWESVEFGESLAGDRPRLIRHHTEFHALVVRLSGNHTMNLLNGILRQIIDTANFQRVDTDPAGAAHDAAFHHGLRAHRRLVELIEAKDAEGANALWMKHLVEANRYLLELPGATTVLDLLD
ncbi:MAG: FCD domain-containing protein [Actinomycetota bacterium]